MWIEIFKSGKFTDSSGVTSEFTQNDLKQIASKYNSSIMEDESLEAPIVKGHPKQNEPAYGWVEKLNSKGNKLLAKIKDLTPELVSEINKGMFKKVSIALYPDKMLRHIGLLGAFPPAVKGLKNLAFADNLEFSDYSSELNNIDNLELFEYAERLETENNSLKEIITIKETKEFEHKFQEFAENVQIAGKFKLLPADSDILFKILNFDRNNKLAFTNELFNFLENLKLVEIFSELNIPLQNFSENTSDSERLDLHHKALNFIKANPNYNYEEAINHFL